MASSSLCENLFSITDLFLRRHHVLPTANIDAVSKFCEVEIPRVVDGQVEFARERKRLQAIEEQFILDGLQNYMTYKATISSTKP
jgi:hypothetical protein